MEKPVVPRRLSRVTGDKLPHSDLQCRGKGDWCLLVALQIWGNFGFHIADIFPIPSTYGIFTYIWLIFMVNVGRYNIHVWVLDTSMIQSTQLYT